MSSDMGSNNLFDPMLDKLIEPGSPTRDRTQLSDPMSDKPIEPAVLSSILIPSADIANPKNETLSE
ncbi:hypothetical protein PCANC_12521 [Puccinia coronata f. sp. avenae]|uniref:Uncharacterized protein n=1 Tax=Puccinia coronata f. sp. avenae TaxID=200324 RepID=A0A2N5SSK7_9BASI|nr:hypothetical protein PCANC_12521 [Puccinia coronata f. sp. avenae]